MTTKPKVCDVCGWPLYDDGTCSDVCEEARELRAELRAYREDAAAAAGECRVVCPAPGTDASKLLIANRLMREAVRKAEQHELEACAEADELRAERDAAMRFLADVERVRAEERERAARIVLVASPAPPGMAPFWDALADTIRGDT